MGRFVPGGSDQTRDLAPSWQLVDAVGDATGHRLEAESSEVGIKVATAVGEPIAGIPANDNCEHPSAIPVVRLGEDGLSSW